MWDATFCLDEVPSVAYLLEHRDEQKGERARTRGATPTASPYRMYEYFVTGFMNGLRTEIEYFFNKPWPVSEIPDPKDPDPQRYAILSVLPFYLTVAFNRLIEKGLPRAAPAIITTEMEDQLRSRPKVLEEEPLWAAAVPKLDETLVIPDHRGLRAEEDTISARFRDMNIVAETPHVFRESTHDVDFFNDHLTRQEAEWILRGAREAAAHNNRLAEEWFNNRTILFLSRDIRSSLTDESFRQREVVFRAPGLTVLAAPWDYAFCCKVDRMAGQGLHGARAYDLSDAIQYIHRYVQQRRIVRVPRETVQAWFAFFSLRWTSSNDSVIAHVNHGYRVRFLVNFDVIA